MKDGSSRSSCDSSSWCVSMRSTNSLPVGSGGTGYPLALMFWSPGRRVSGSTKNLDLASYSTVSLSLPLPSASWLCAIVLKHEN
jgi:hypothetical protein